MNQKEPPYITRINHLLKQYEKLLNGKAEKQQTFSQLYAIIVNFYGYDINALNKFYVDYGDYVTNIDNDKIYTKYDQICDIQNCQYIKRRYFERIQARIQTTWDQFLGTFVCHYRRGKRC